MYLEGTDSIAVVSGDIKIGGGCDRWKGNAGQQAQGHNKGRVTDSETLRMHKQRWWPGASVQA